MHHQGSRVSHVLHKSQPSEDVHTPSGSRDLDEAAQDARGSMTPEALPPQTGESAYHRGSTALAPTPPRAPDGLVVLLLQVVCTQRRATDATDAVGHEQLGTVLTDLTGALCGGCGDPYIGHFTSNTGAYLSHTLSPYA